MFDLVEPIGTGWDDTYGDPALVSDCAGVLLKGNCAACVGDPAD